MHKIKSWLPLFTGYYETIFDNTPDDLRYVFTQEELDFIEENSDEYTDAPELAMDMIDWSRCQELKSKRIVNAVRDLLKEENLINSIEYDSTHSPREYNFATDSINVTYTFTERNIDNIKKVLSDNWPEFKENIKRKYTSRDGFISFHSSDACSKDWNLEFILDNEDAHKLGEILDFCLKVSGYNIESIYYSDEYRPSAVVFECIKKEYQDRENRIEYIKNELQYDEKPDPLEEIGYYNPNQIELFKEEAK